MATQQITGRQIRDGVISDNHIASGAGIASTKLANWSADRNAGGNKLTNLANGTAAGDAINKAQLDAAITASAAGLAIKAPVRVASTTNISGSYNATGGTSGRGQLTSMPNAVDGVSLAGTNRVLLKNQTAPEENGIWVVSTLGSGSNGVWDRADDFDSDDEVTDGTFVFVGEGSANAATQWLLTTDEAIVVGGSSGSNLVFQQFGAGTSYSADEVTIKLNAGEFSIKAGGVGTTELANDSVTNDKIADDAVNTAQLATNSVTDDAIADGAVGTNALAADAVTNAKLADNAVQQENIADSAVGTAEIANDAVTSDKLATNSVTDDAIADNAVGTGAIAASAVTGGKIAFIAQTVTGDVNDINDAFTTSAAATPGSLIFWINGVRQRPTTDFTYSGSTITCTTPPETGDDLAVFGVTA